MKGVRALHASRRKWTVTRSGAAKASRGVEGDERIGIETSGNAGSPFSVSSLGWTTTSRTTHPRLGRNPSAADSRAPRCWRMRLSRGRPSPRFAEGSRRRTGAGLDLLGLEDMVVAEVALGGGGAREAGGAELAGVHERWGQRVLARARGTHRSSTHVMTGNTCSGAEMRPSPPGTQPTHMRACGAFREPLHIRGMQAVRKPLADGRVRHSQPRPFGKALAATR
jgi:hypothetical protein